MPKYEIEIPYSDLVVDGKITMVRENGSVFTLRVKPIPAEPENDPDYYKRRFFEATNAYARDVMKVESRLSELERREKERDEKLSIKFNATYAPSDDLKAYTEPPKILTYEEWVKTNEFAVRIYKGYAILTYKKETERMLAVEYMRYVLKELHLSVVFAFAPTPRLHLLSSQIDNRDRFYELMGDKLQIIENLFTA